MANFLEKAKNFLFLAESKAEFNLFGINHQMAADNFFRAANYYMLAESWEEAGSTYVKLANFYFKTERKDRAARAFVDAALCYEQLDTTEPPVYCLEHAVNLFCDIGHLSKAARYLKEIAELYENEQNIEQAIVYYERSADFYQNDEMTTSANQCKQKVAQFAAQLEQYQKSIEIYEEIARQSLSNNWTKHETKCHLLNAGICELCKRDPVAINNALEIYQELDPTFTETREYSLLVDVAAAIDKQDVRKFTNVVNDFDSMTPLDSLKRTLIMRVKKKIFIF